MIDISNLTKTKVDKDLLKRIGSAVLEKEGIKKEVEISVALVSKKEIQELNRMYRGKDEPTDVLSFNEGSEFVLPPGQPKRLGEIVISPSQIKGKKPKELARVFVHGLLHLLGYDHKSAKSKKLMQFSEQKYLSPFFKKK